MATAATIEAGEAKPGIPVGGDEANNALRFEDLTIDDDLPLLDRVVRYCRSGIALQRLVHVKMLAETSETVGMSLTLNSIVPLLTPLVSDPESIIRQHLASQLLPLSITCMVMGVGPHGISVEEILKTPSVDRNLNDVGYEVVIDTLVSHLGTLIMDTDMDVRRSASESLAELAPHIRKRDVGNYILPVPLKMSQETKPRKGAPDGFQEELRITAANLLAELSGAAEIGQIPTSCVQEYIMPTVLQLCEDPSFRVRRSAAQALPRVLGGTSLADAQEKIMPAFEKLSKDDMYRVRKSTGECLVDMSRSLMILAASKEVPESKREILKEMRRKVLIPIAIELLQDANKFVRHGMMQFLGPFIASFYPLQEGALNSVLPGSGADSPAAAQNIGIGSQFFPHASSMVSRLNSSATTNASSPTPTPATLDTPEKKLSYLEKLEQALPPFIRSNRLAYLSLAAVVEHRRANPPMQQDVIAIKNKLLGQFVALAQITTGDENTDAEMRVYCAYSYPAVVLLLGPENWEGDLKTCFMKLVNPNYGDPDSGPAVPPLPVKRCLASSLHTVAHVLGSDLTVRDILPVFRENFFGDTDDSVRLNVIRNFPSLVSLFPKEMRTEYLSMWNDIAKGEDLLGAFKRSATNPMLLNWRQRDFVSRSMPDMLGLFGPLEVQQYLWPVMQMLLVDSVCLVREDAEWSIALLLRAYCVEDDGSSNKRWSADVCKEVIVWLKDTILGVQKTTKGDQGRAANFSKRQLYCRICAAVALSIRFGDLKPSEQWDGNFRAAVSKHETYVPYQTLSAGERKQLRRLLVYDMLPPALEMKDDRVTNVRLTLMKVLQEMPDDIKQLASVHEVLQELEDEVETWESFNGGEQQGKPQPQMAPMVNANSRQVPRQNANDEQGRRTTNRERMAAFTGDTETRAAI